MWLRSPVFCTTQTLPANGAMLLFHPTFASAPTGQRSQSRSSSAASPTTRTRAPLGKSIHLVSRIAFRAGHVTAASTAEPTSRIHAPGSKSTGGSAPRIPTCTSIASWKSAAPSCIQRTLLSWNSSTRFCAGDISCSRQRSKSFLAPARSGPGIAACATRRRPRSEKNRNDVSWSSTPLSTSSPTVCLAAREGVMPVPMGRFVVGLVRFVLSQVSSAERS
mmetsp:Transcript_33779/g.102046  ORF Transcript_33779/g.102046 Transcript_33779/m.102046 type:complete len:220 (-) Transcript_33779:125-784(-)